MFTLRSSPFLEVAEVEVRELSFAISSANQATAWLCRTAQCARSRVFDVRAPMENREALTAPRERGSKGVKQKSRARPVDATRLGKNKKQF
jgi:hypothetical protein